VDKARALGMNVLLNDPPRARSEGLVGFVELEELCQRADIISLHVPHQRVGIDATHHLFARAQLSRLPTGVSLLNSSRGEVVDGGALLSALDAGRLGFVALDVWEGEPNIDVALLERVDVGTPHVAGYGADGKVRGTEMLHDAFAAHFGLEATWRSEGVLPAGPSTTVSEGRTVRDICREVYDVRADDARLRAGLGLGRAPERAREFDRLRKTHPSRREFSRAAVTVAPGASDRVVDTLMALGFVVGDR
jgi:erythronate-4-phosphate dehydrogenase